MPARNRWPCGPSYLGPGNRSVTAETGQTVLHTLHLMQWSAVCSTCSTAASGSAGRGGGEQGGDPAAGQDQLLAAGGEHAGGALAADGGDADAVARQPDRREAELHARAELLQQGPVGGEQARAGDRGRGGRGLVQRRPDQRLEV